MYISEISPLNLRGGLGTVNQLAVTIGLLISQILGIKQLLGTDEGWPVLLGELSRVYVARRNSSEYILATIYKHDRKKRSAFSLISMICRFGRLSSHIAINFVTNLSGVPAIPFDYQAMGRRG